MAKKRYRRAKIGYTDTEKKEINQKYETMIGNLNAELYTEERAKDIFLQAIELTKERETYTNDKGLTVTASKYDFIGEIATALDLYKEIFLHLEKRFPKLKPLHNELHTRIENNCYSNTKKGLIKEATGIVNLKSNYRWTDRTQVDVSAEKKRIQELFPDIPENE